MVHIRQSPNDKREYRYVSECYVRVVRLVGIHYPCCSCSFEQHLYFRLITLKNGLKALIVREEKKPIDDASDGEESESDLDKNQDVSGDDEGEEGNDEGGASEEEASSEPKKGKQMVL